MHQKLVLPDKYSNDFLEEVLFNFAGKDILSKCNIQKRGRRLLISPQPEIALYIPYLQEQRTKLMKYAKNYEAIYTAIREVSAFGVYIPSSGTEEDYAV